MAIESKADISTNLQEVELFIDPLQSDLTEKIVKNSSVSTVYYTRIKDDNEEFKIVKAFTPLFRFLLDDNDRDDSSEITEENLKNKIISITPDIHSENSKIIQEGKNYVAAVDGVFIIDNGIPKIINVSLDGSADVKVSEDSMKVLIDLYPSIEDHPIPTLNDIIKKIKNLGIVSEINRDFIQKNLDEVKESKQKKINICVSEGIPPQNGIDGRLENCTDKKEKLKNFNFDEFYKVNPVISVKTGETIAVVHPPTEGTPGQNVFGSKIDQIQGKEYKIKLGKNTQYDEEENTRIIAKIDGFVDLSESSIQVTDTFTVKGDIDFKSGNIFSKGSLVVTGNVNNEFKLNLSKDIEIGGYVGDAIIEAGSSITIKGGFLGKGKGILKAEDDIKVKFVENQKVFTRGSLLIEKEALNANLYVKNKIASNGSHAVIVGGHSIAGESITINSLGNASESETILEVGFDYLKRNSLLSNKEKQSKLFQTLEEVDKNILEFAQMKRLNDQGREKVKALALEHKKIAAEIDKLKEQNLKITNEIYIPTDSKIIVNGTIYPGVKIGINGRFMIIKEPLRSKTFILSADNEVIAV